MQTNFLLKRARRGKAERLHAGSASGPPIDWRGHLGRYGASPGLAVDQRELAVLSPPFEQAAPRHGQIE